VANITPAQIKAIVEKAVKEGVKEGLAGVVKPTVVMPTSSQSSDDAFRAQGAAYQNRGWNALAAHLHPEGGTEPATEQLRGPGDPYNSRGWAALGELLKGEAQHKDAR
jgi:hypothetical protein